MRKLQQTHRPGTFSKDLLMSFQPSFSSSYILPSLPPSHRLDPTQALLLAYRQHCICPFHRHRRQGLARETQNDPHGHILEGVPLSAAHACM